MTIERLTPQPGEVIDRNTPVDFSWNGKSLSGFAGDTVASAILSDGTNLFSRSLKLHRPRGVMTADNWDPNTLVQINAEPNVRAGHRLIRDGDNVTAQNVWPSLTRDLGAINGKFSRFLTAGFYYKTFMRPAWLVPTYERVLSGFAPGGVIDLETPAEAFDTRFAHPDVVVAGGGPAGMAAALAAAQGGASVLLIEHSHQLGGHLCWGSAADRAHVTELADALRVAGVETLTNSTVTGRYDNNWLGIVQRSHPGISERLIKARAKSLVVAAGLIERPYIFAGNDLPGVMLSGAARRLINMYAIRPGSTAVVLTANADGDATVADLERVGVNVAAVVDARKGETIRQADGRRSLRSVTLGTGQKIAADLLVTAVGWTAPTSLLNMAGDRPHYVPSAARFFPTDPPVNVLVTGGLVGDGTFDEIVAHGCSTGELAAQRAAAVAHRLQRTTARAASPVDSEPEFPADLRTPLPIASHPELFRSETHGFVDFSEDVGSKDLFAAATEGFDSVELVKRFTTATMGPSQGKLETVNTVAVLGEAVGETIAEVGTTVWRPPFTPVTLGALGGRLLEPVRHSAIHPWHVAHDMTPIVAGQWIRPEHYGDPVAEVRNVRTNVGITDVTPLGKLDLQGPDVPNLLDLLYTNKWQKLPIGSVRYGIMCGDDGVVLDDGVTGRLGEEHYLMTTTSSGAAGVWGWAENWLQTERPHWNVKIAPITAAYTSINVAGPKSRELLQRLVDDVDLDSDSFAYMRVRVGTVAGVSDCIVWRIGFTGELSFEIHVPAGYGLHVWEQLLEHGTDLGVAPFGLEAQRILRLEKGHFIVGQDTDGLTKANALGMDPLIKFDKADFAGKLELAWGAGKSGPMLVALQPTDPLLVPEEGCQLVVDGTNKIIGRITSSRFSPTLERSVCLGHVRNDLAIAGDKVTVVLGDGTRSTVKIMAHHCHFDPEGERLRG